MNVNRIGAARVLTATAAWACLVFGAAEADVPRKAGEHFSFAGERPGFHEDDIDKIEVVVAGADSEGRLSLVESIWTTRFTVPPHYHTMHAETFYIVSGKVEWTIGGRTQVVGPGDAVHIPANTVHSVRVLETMRSLMFFQPGGYEELVALDAFYSAEQKKDPKVRAHLDRMTDFNRVTGTVPVLPPPVAGRANKAMPVFSFKGRREGFREPLVENVEIVLSGAESEGRLSIIESDWLPGFTAPTHFHRRHGETFYVFSGRMEWTVNGSTRVIGAGDAVHIPANVEHSVKVLEKAHTLWISDPGGLEEAAMSAQQYSAAEREEPKVRAWLQQLGDFHLPTVK